jgi:hypothetical protein
MLIIQVLVALLLGTGYLCFPPSSLHDFPGTKNGLLKAIMTVEPVGILNQVGVIDIPPTITVTDTWNIPGRVVDGTGYELAEF